MKEDKEFEFDFERLNVYKKALEFIDKIFMVLKKLPREYRYSLGDNLLRSGLSIANNLAEGSGKKFKKEKGVITEPHQIQRENVYLSLMF